MRFRIPGHLTCGFVWLALLVIAPRLVLAQQSQQNPFCIGGSASGDFEIGVVMQTVAYYTIVMTDMTTGLELAGSRRTINSWSPTRYLCHYWAHYDAVGSEDPNRVQFERDRLYRIDMFPSDEPPGATGTLPRASFYTYHSYDTAPGSNIFSPIGYTDPDIVFFIDNERIRTYPTQLPCHYGDPGCAVEDNFPSGRWALPYDAFSICLPSCPLIPSESYVFVTPAPFGNTGPSTLPIQITAADGADWRVPAGRTYYWSASDVSAIQFGNDGHLTVHGSLNVTGSPTLGTMTLTAANPSWGWGGVRFLLGSDGTWSGGTVVERVAGGCPPSHCFTSTAGAAVSVTNASPDFDGVTINEPVPGSYVHGLRVTGTGASPLATNLTITDMTASGVYAHGGATPELRGDQVILQRNAESAVLASGSGTRVFLSPVLVGSVSRGPRIENNPGGGVAATAYGRVTFTGPSGGLGFANLEGNPGRGLTASGGGQMEAGTFFSYNRNRILNNGGTSTTGNGRATGAGTTVMARCNWWGTATPSGFRVGAVSGATFDTHTFLGDNPYSNPNVACTDGGGATEGRTAGGVLTTARYPGTLGDAPTSSVGGGATPADRLEAAFDLAPADALAVLIALVDDAPDTPEAASALTLAGTLASQPDVPAATAFGAVALLMAQTASARASLVQAAHQALVGVRLASGDASGALAAAAALVAMGGAAERSGHAAEVFVHGEGDVSSALAALSSLEASWPDSDEALAAREHLAALGVSLPEGRQGAPEMAEAPKVAAHAAEPTVGPSLSVAPNPSAAGASVLTLTLAEAADVRVVVYDLIGRETAVVLDGVLPAGAHAAAVPALAPGVYAVRATDGAGATLSTVRLTVVR